MFSKHFEAICLELSVMGSGLQMHTLVINAGEIGKWAMNAPLMAVRGKCNITSITRQTPHESTPHIYGALGQACF